MLVSGLLELATHGARLSQIQHHCWEIRVSMQQRGPNPAVSHDSEGLLSEISREKLDFNESLVNRFCGFPKSCSCAHKSSIHFYEGNLMKPKQIPHVTVFRQDPGPKIKWTHEFTMTIPSAPFSTPIWMFPKIIVPPNHPF